MKRINISLLISVAITSAALSGALFAGEEQPNVLYGVGAGLRMTTGQENTAIGVESLAATRVGSGNTAVGSGALNRNVEGYENTAIGKWALLSNKESSNSAVGAFSLYKNKSGIGNSALGWAAGMEAFQGLGNTALGAKSLMQHQTATYNTVVGYEAMRGPNRPNSESYWNTVIGAQAGMNLTGHRNVLIGHKAGLKLFDVSDTLIISNSDTDTPLISGDFAQPRVRINGALEATTVTQSSDARLKKDIAPLHGALDKVLRLEAKSYKWKDESAPEGSDIGLIAQDVEKILPELVSEDQNGYKAIAYAKLTAILIEAIKEQEKKIEALTIKNQEITSLREENTSLKTHMADQEIAMANQQQAIDTLMTRMANLESTSLVEN